MLVWCMTLGFGVAADSKFTQFKVPAVLAGDFV